MEYFMKLHEDPKLFREALRATSDYMNLREVYLEKDYWVTYVLKLIYAEKIGQDVVFKGGTALSKCYGIIPRFSEDIDLVVYRRDGESDTALKNKLKRISSLIDSVLPEMSIDGITRKFGMNRKTAHGYSKAVTGKYGQVRDFIVVESSWMGFPEPNVKHEVSSYIHDMMIAQNLIKMIEMYDLKPFAVQVLSLERTFCEKIMSLVRFSYSNYPLLNLANKIRHTYDLHLMLKKDSINDFLRSEKFDALLISVAQDDKASFKSGTEWLSNHPAEALLFRDLETAWKELIPAYSIDFRAIVYGEFPDQQEVYNSLRDIQARLKRIHWEL